MHWAAESKPEPVPSLYDLRRADKMSSRTPAQEFLADFGIDGEKLSGCHRV